MQTLENPVAETDLKSKIKYEVLVKLSTNGKSSFLISIVNATLIYITLGAVAEPIVLNLWYLAIVITSFLRLVMIALFWKLHENHPRLDLWTAVYLVFIYFSGLCWGVLPLWNVFFIAEYTQALIVFVIAGMSAGGLVALYPMLLAAIPYTLIILLPLLFVLASTGEPASITMSVLTGMYIIMLVRSIYTLNGSAVRSIRLEIENSELFQFLLKARG